MSTTDIFKENVSSNLFENVIIEDLRIILKKIK